MLEVPRLKKLPIIADHRFREEITSKKTADLVQSTNWGWATTGARVGAWLWANPWTTTSTSWSTASSNFGPDLDQLSPIITPMREEIGALSSGQGSYVLDVQVYGQRGELEVSLYARAIGEATFESTPAATGIVAMGAVSGWASASFLVTSQQRGAEYRIALRARSTGGEASINQVQIDETRYSNAAVGGAAVVYGSEYVGALSEAERVYAWDSDGIGGALEPDSVAVMRRDAVAPGVHAVDIGIGARFASSTQANLGAHPSLMVAVALDASVFPLDVVPFFHSSAFSLARDFSHVFTARARSSTGAWAQVVSPAQPQRWIDVLLYANNAAVSLYIDGELIGTAAKSSGLYGGSAPIYLGEVKSRFAMPAVFSGDFTPRDAANFMAWRRSIHGIY